MIEHKLNMWYNSFVRGVLIMTANDKTVKTLVDAMVETGLVRDIFLFGSYARGDYNADSDIDFCVLVDDDARIKSVHDMTVMLHDKIWDIKKPPVDLLVYQSKNFFYRADCPVTFEHQILKEGIQLYGHTKSSA